MGNRIPGKRPDSVSENEWYGETLFFVKPKNQEPYLFKKTKGGEYFNHSNFPQSENNPDREVEAAGAITFKDGKIVNITNSSGHYQPDPEIIEKILVNVAVQLGVSDIRALLDDKSRNNNGDYENMVTDITDVIEKQKSDPKLQQLSLISLVARPDVATKPLKKATITKINAKIARELAKNSIRGRGV